ncbi:MAG: YitT family protein [Desulfotomaculaceae bacterium]|nr:YitT family protein [Desulfotomaculaceae bacterium]
MSGKEPGSIKKYFPAPENAKIIMLNLIFITAGALLIALSLNTILIPYGLLAGGITGLSLIFFYLFKIPIFLSILVLNIPVFWWGAREISRSFFFYSLAGTVALSILQPATYGYIQPFQLDMVLAAIFGGVLSGAGFGLVFRGNSSTGGTDIIAVVLRKKKGLGIGEVSFYANLLVIIISLFFFPLNIGLYTIISIFVTGKMIDVIITGLNVSKSAFIVSNKSSEISVRIIAELHRGITYLTGKGAFTHDEKTVINCVINRFEMARLKNIVAETDPDAFMYISDTSEVLGWGFSRSK